ncbi:hypothetical protein RJD38_21250 [Vibrio scophthalmi]|uniref:hypothetical protein n=1 Tax=Vibrio scophthalmi TaxID=45658 RepID=UPI00349F8405
MTISILLIAASLMVAMVCGNKVRLCLIAVMGIYLCIDMPPTLQLMFLGVLVATWQSLLSIGERHEKTRTH